MEIQELRRRAEQWLKTDPDPSSAAEIARLLERDDREALLDRFGSSLEFGTAGLRGIVGAGANRMNRAVVRRTTEGLARYLKEKIADVHQRGVVVGRDGRHLSQQFAEDAAGVLSANGIPALVFEGLVPTPLVSFATIHLGASAGIMITASHNPPEYNGYKVYWQNGAQIIPPHDRGISESIRKVGNTNEIALLGEAKARSQGLWREVGSEVSDGYIRAMLNLRLQPTAESDLKIVYTPMHGVGAPWVERLFEQAGFRSLNFVQEQREPDPNFPTVRFPNPEEPGALDLSIGLAEKIAADLVLANDPDADRLAVVARQRDGRLQALGGNEVGVLLGHYLLTQGPKVPKPLVITTIVSSGQLRRIAADLGAGYDETLTGFKWIANRALERAKSEGTTFVFGYEEALGYCVGGVTRDKDGISAALLFAEMADWCRRTGKTVHQYLEEIQQRHGLFVAKQRSFTYAGTRGAETIKEIMETCRREPVERIGPVRVSAVRDYLWGEIRTAGGAEPLPAPRADVIAFELEGGSRITVRPSGTEPKVKYYFEHHERISAHESLALAKERANHCLTELEGDFLAKFERFQVKTS